MKSLKLLSKSSQKLLRHEKELSVNDVEEIPKSITPGEWIIILDETQKRKYIGYMNPHSESFFNIKVLKSEAINWIPKLSEEEIAKSIIQEIMIKAIDRRKLFKDYDSGSRLIYGNADSIPGLIVDKYKKYILVQINTAGLDRFRNFIKKILENNYPKHIVILFDNAEYRKLEILPSHEQVSIEDDLEIEENGLNYIIKKNAIQKIGYYYDHRENRQKLLNKMLSMGIEKNTGLDLFSYVGSWGMHLLKAGVDHVDFVDQANMDENILTNLKLNKMEGRGTFYRKDVFKYLDELISSNKSYDVIVSDPPAFTKSEKNKLQAIQGYEKLHLKALKLLKHNGLFVAASCTHYVNLEELDKTVQDSGYKNNLKLQLLDVGIQGHDHPMTSFKDKGFYIKYLLYLVQKG